MIGEQTFTVGQMIRARYDYDHQRIKKGQVYEVVDFTPAHYLANFTFPPYVTVRLENGKTYTSHTHHYEPMENKHG